MNLGLEGKTALITAASGGIGSGIAAALADAGVLVAVSGRSHATLEQVAGSLASRAGGRPVIVVGDVCAQGGPAQIAAEAAKALGGRIDILVNNAGGARPATGEVDDAFWDEAMTLNFLAARRLTDLIAPGMKARNWGGSSIFPAHSSRPGSTERRRPRRLSSAGQEHYRQNSVHLA
jgi:3-oxoacyl-[acyl-carrier protein] reductase